MSFLAKLTSFYTKNHFVEKQVFIYDPVHVSTHIVNNSSYRMNLDIILNCTSLVAQHQHTQIEHA
jgi:hypothetical protein